MDLKATVVAEFEDKYGETKKICQIGRRRFAIAKNKDTVITLLNREAAVLIGQKIKDRRVQCGLTLAELCEQAGLVSSFPKQRMWEIENSIRKNGLRMGTLFALASALDCEATDLMPTVEDVRDLAGVDFETEIKKTLTS